MSMAISCHAHYSASKYYQKKMTSEFLKIKNLKLNLGCGNKKINGWINIDSSDWAKPDLIMNLENLPYPFATNTVSEINMKSVIEHLTSDTNKFFNILQEIYRICDDRALIHIECPHPNHRWQHADMTHVRSFHPESFKLLSKKSCRKLVEQGSTRSPLALMYDIDFEIIEASGGIDQTGVKHIENILGTYDETKIKSYVALFNNIAATQKITLMAKK